MSFANYTIRLEAGKPNKQGEVRIYIRVTINKRLQRVPTTVKVKEKHFVNERVVKHPLAKAYNDKINQERIEVEQKIIDGIPLTNKVSRDSLKDIINAYLDENIGRDSEATKKSKKSSLNKILEWRPDIKVSDINEKSPVQFENYLWEKGQDRNTIHKRMIHFKLFCKIAKVKKDYFDEYKPPAADVKIPVHLTEKQIDDFAKIVFSLNQQAMKVAGYYFLLSCYAGYRISDLMAFDYDKYVRGDQLIVRAKKNGSIVSIPLYPKLKRVVEWCKDNPPDIAEPTMRKYVKDIAKAAGITLHVKVHTGRHSFACLMLTKGLDMYEVSELLGDSLEVARIYARITNKNLTDKINRIM